MLTIEQPAGTAEVRELILEYAKATDVDLSFQGFSDEIADLRGFYLALFLARWDGQPAGCVALRRIDGATAEMKRLYVRDAFRGKDIGRALALQVIEEARQRGFARMRLDTLPTMTSALALYRSLGFVDIEPYRYNPVEGTAYLELTLEGSP
jgi:ribosomal protein S18 acetylase RimI-like enzyme